VHQQDRKYLKRNDFAHQFGHPAEQGIEVEGRVERVDQFQQEGLHIDCGLLRGTCAGMWGGRGHCFSSTIANKTRLPRQPQWSIFVENHSGAPSSRTIFTPALVPSRLAPAWIMATASCAVRTPPDAFTPSLSPTTPRIRAMSSAVAPPPANPVEVFTKSA